MKLNLPLTSSAPGKVILFGEQAVVLGKTAISGSIQLRTFIHFESIDNYSNSSEELFLLLKLNDLNK
jgi:mevalonate kinase